MSTQSDIDAIKRLLERKQSVPSQLIRSLVMTCENLKTIAAQQSKKIAELESKLVEKDGAS